MGLDAVEIVLRTEELFVITIEISLGSPRALFHLANNVGNFSPFDVTADGRRFLVAEPNSPAGTVPLTLVTNWDAELKKR